MTQIETSSGVNTGVRLHSLIPGMVPPYEEALARRASGYKAREWLELEPFERAVEVALYRIDKKIEAISADAEKAALDRKAK